MYKEVLSAIDGVEIYPIISLLIFFSFFVGVGAWFFLADRERLQRLAQLPLDGEAETTAKETGNHG